MIFPSSFSAKRQIQKVLLKNGIDRNEVINELIEKAKDDKNEVLVNEVKSLT